jgi:hypothetical protein
VKDEVSRLHPLIASLIRGHRISLLALSRSKRDTAVPEGRHDASVHVGGPGQLREHQSESYALPWGYQFSPELNETGTRALPQSVCQIIEPVDHRLDAI